MTHGTTLEPIYTGDKQTPSQANWYQNKKDDPEFRKQQQEKAANQRRKKKEWWKELTKYDVCEDCGETEYLEYHHLPGTIKLFNLGDGKFRYGREKIICEKAKCIPLCPICHRKRHYG